MPDWLAEYRPELWSEDPDDDLERYYFGRFRWQDACDEWAAGGNPQPLIQSPRPVQGDGVNTSSIPAPLARGSRPTSDPSRIEES